METGPTPPLRAPSPPPYHPVATPRPLLLLDDDDGLEVGAEGGDHEDLLLGVVLPVQPRVHRRPLVHRRRQATGGPMNWKETAFNGDTWLLAESNVGVE